MTACPCGLGDTSSWWRLYARETEVYLWRAKLSGDLPKAPEDALVLLAAVMRGAKSGLDARGVCFYATEGGGYALDVVMTIRAFGYRETFFGWDADAVAQAVMADGSVRAAMPNLQIEEPEWLELEGPKQALDFWLSHTVVWDNALAPDAGGAPTQAFANVDGVYKAPADAGLNAPRWKPAPSPLGPDGQGGENGKEDQTVLWAAGIGLAVLALYWLTRKEQRRP